MKENERDNPLKLSIKRFPSVISKWEVKATTADDDGDSDDGSSESSSESRGESSDNPNDAGDSGGSERSETADR
jgi:hypothetical protein